MSAFAYEAELEAIFVPQGALLTYAEFGNARKAVANPPAAIGGDCYVWCVHDEEDDVAIVVAAIRTDHLERISSKIEWSKRRIEERQERNRGRVEWVRALRESLEGVAERIRR